MTTKEHEVWTKKVSGLITSRYGAQTKVIGTSGSSKKPQGTFIPDFDPSNPPETLVYEICSGEGSSYLHIKTSGEEIASIIHSELSIKYNMQGESELTIAELVENDFNEIVSISADLEPVGIDKLANEPWQKDFEDHIAIFARSYRNGSRPAIGLYETEGLYQVTGRELSPAKHSEIVGRLDQKLSKRGVYYVLDPQFASH